MPRHLAIITSPVPGHLNPVQVLATALAARGHRATIVHVAGTRRFLRTGPVGFAPLPDRSEALDDFHHTLARATGPVGMVRMIRATAGLTEALLADAPEVIGATGADAILADAVEPAGPLIAARLGLPLVSAVTGLPLLRDDSVPPPFVSWPYRSGALARFNNRGGYAVADLLMRPVTRVLARYRRAWALREAEPLIEVAQCPRSLDFPRADLPATFRYGGRWRAPVEEAVSLDEAGRPLVFCSLGTLQGARFDLIARIAAACAAVGARAVIGHGGGLTAAQEALLPGAPLVRAFWPQEAVLSHCAAAVLHGGFNSVLDALAAGVPIVALPIAFEQPGTAARLAWSGAGVVVPMRRASTARLAAALDRVLTEPGYRAAAGRLAGELAGAGGADAAADAITAALAPVGSPAAATRARPD